MSNPLEPINEGKIQVEEVAPKASMSEAVCQRIGHDLNYVKHSVDNMNAQLDAFQQGDLEITSFFFGAGSYPFTHGAPGVQAGVIVYVQGGISVGGNPGPDTSGPRALLLGYHTWVPFPSGSIINPIDYDNIVLNASQIVRISGVWPHEAAGQLFGTVTV